MAAAEQDYYLILGVSESASTDEIRSAYRRAVRTCHPDTHPTDPSAGERFKAIQRAYEVLSDPPQRAAYRRPTAWGGSAPTASRPPSTPPAPPPDLHSTASPDVWDVIEAARIVARRRIGRRFRQLLRYLEGL